MWFILKIYALKLSSVFLIGRKEKQEVSIDMEFPFDCKKAAATDSIEDAIDYKAITKGRH